MASVQVQVRIPEELMRRMDAYVADVAGAFPPSRSGVIRRLIEEGLTAHEATKSSAKKQEPARQKTAKGAR